MTEGEYRVYLIKMPGCIRGAVRVDADGFPSIYINECLGPDERKAALQHEMRHIQNDDFYNDKPIEEVEKE